MTDQLENIPSDEIKRLSAQAINDNKNLLNALAEYDIRIVCLPFNIHIPVMIFKSKGLSSQCGLEIVVESNNIANSQTQNLITIWSTSISSQATTKFSGQNTIDLVTQAA
jgi:hypothetical protein